jgi:hypothetical protein
MIGLVSNFPFRIFGRVRKLPKSDPKLIKLLKSFESYQKVLKLVNHLDSQLIPILYIF